ncbi:hypothetical protein PJL18_02326 [Paenarthrobacter nicotinovorans]|nr:hypothetical protein [Paenarthrobacter nicotinovorans]
MIREEVKVLEHHADAGPQDVRLHLEGTFAGQEHVAAFGLVQAVDAAQERGLAGAGWTDDAGGGARGHGEADVAEYFHVPVGHGQVLQFQAGSVELFDVLAGLVGAGCTAAGEVHVLLPVMSGEAASSSLTSFSPLVGAVGRRRPVRNLLSK